MTISWRDNLKTEHKALLTVSEMAAEAGVSGLAFADEALPFVALALAIRDEAEALAGQVSNQGDDTPGDPLPVNPFVAQIELAWRDAEAEYTKYARSGDTYFGHYFAWGYGVDGLVSAYVATRNPVWLQRAMALVEAVIATAVKPTPVVGDGYYGWTSKQRNGKAADLNEYAHDEAQGTRAVMRLLRVMDAHAYRRDWVADKLAWLNANVVDKWLARGEGYVVMYQRPQKSCTWAQVLQHAAALTGDTRYYEVGQRAAAAVLSASVPNPVNADAVCYSAPWDKDFQYLDMRHWNQVVSAVVEAAVWGASKLDAQLVGSAAAWRVVWDGSVDTPQFAYTLGGETVAGTDRTFRPLLCELAKLGAWDSSVLDVVGQHWQADDEPFTALANAAWAWQRAQDSAAVGVTG